MTTHAIPVIPFAGHIVAPAAQVGGPPANDGTAAEVILTKPDREWVRVFENGRFGAVHRFGLDGVLKMSPPTQSSWRTREIKAGRLFINGEMPCDIVQTTVIRGEHEKGRFVLVPKTEAWEPATVDPAPRPTIQDVAPGAQWHEIVVAW